MHSVIAIWAAASCHAHACNCPSPIMCIICPPAAHHHQNPLCNSYWQSCPGFESKQHASPSTQPNLLCSAVSRCRGPRSQQKVLTALSCNMI